MIDDLRPRPFSLSLSLSHTHTHTTGMNNSVLHQSVQTMCRYDESDNVVVYASTLLNTFGNKNKKRLLPVDFEPNCYTVLVGRNRNYQDYAGNKRLRAIIGCHLKEYQSCTDKLEKTELVSKVYNQVIKTAPVGHFVKFDKGRYYDIGVRASRERVGVIFREMLKSKAASHDVITEGKRKSASCNMGKNGTGQMFNVQQDTFPAPPPPFPLEYSLPLDIECMPTKGSLIDNSDEPLTLPTLPVFSLFMDDSPDDLLQDLSSFQW